MSGPKVRSYHIPAPGLGGSSLGPQPWLCPPPPPRSSLLACFLTQILSWLPPFGFLGFKPWWAAALVRFRACQALGCFVSHKQLFSGHLPDNSSLDPRFQGPTSVSASPHESCPGFLPDLRLQLLDVKSNPYLLKALYGLLMLLPQSNAFQLLSHRLQCVPNPELMQTA